jgi:NAD(P)-dependent dehydrogenase (short-subunit alcohol dehydrogenase family)
VARVLVTGSTTGLGRAAAEQLLDEGHEVVLHARSPARAEAVGDLTDRGAAVVIGDLAGRAGTREVADAANDLGGVTAVIHNAAVYVDRSRVATPEGHARTFAVNVLAPYLLTAWISGPTRHIYLSSGMHLSGVPSLDDLDWTARRWDGTQAYCDSKLHVTTLAFVLGAQRPSWRAHAVNPGWVPTRMGGPGAPDDLALGHSTQAWLAVTEDPDTAEPGYWFHQRREAPAPAALDPRFQTGLLAALADLTGVELP